AAAHAQCRARFATVAVAARAFVVVSKVAQQVFAPATPGSGIVPHLLQAPAAQLLQRILLAQRGLGDFRRGLPRLHVNLAPCQLAESASYLELVQDIGKL